MTLMLKRSVLLKRAAIAPPQIWLRVRTLATQGRRDTASSNCIPATPIDAFVGGGYVPNAG